MYVVMYINAICCEKKWNIKPCKTLRQAKWWATHLEKKGYKAFAGWEKE